jgi:heparosan-N-sulfate-glucuronate 5-epimerase
VAVIALVVSIPGNLTENFYFTETFWMMRMAFGSYLVDFKSKIPYRAGPLDRDGVPMFDVRRFRLSGPPVYHPTPIVQYALANYDLAVAGDKEAENRFSRCAEWLERNAVEEYRGRFVTWPIPFSLRTPRLSAGWISGMTQGQALSVLVRAYEYSRGPNIEQIARRAAAGFHVEVKDGGLVTRTPGGDVFIEEIAGCPRTQILNGCLYGLFGVFEFAQTFEDREIARLIDAVLITLEAVLPRYDTGYWSRYSLGMRWNLASPYYHGVHVAQLERMATLFNRPMFRDVARRWARFGESRWCRARQQATALLQVNCKRALTVARLDALKYGDGIFHGTSASA